MAANAMRVGKHAELMTMNHDFMKDLQNHMRENTRGLIQGTRLAILNLVPPKKTRAAVRTDLAVGDTVLARGPAW